MSRSILVHKSPASLAITPLVALLACGLLLPGFARGQGVLINVNVNDSIRLPRPIIIYPPHPVPRPEPVPQETYKIKELSMHAKLSDQVAKVQVIAIVR